MKESEFQRNLIKEIKVKIPNSLVMKTNPNYIQGIPDLIVLANDKWAALEVKESANAKHQPNQDLYIARLDKMSFARFVYPENKQEVMNELEQTLQSARNSRSIQRKSRLLG